MSIYTTKWISEKTGFDAPVFRKHFSAENVVEAQLDICGLGWFEVRLNGVSPDDSVLNPAVSTYAQLGDRKNHYGVDDIFVSPRVYFCRFDVTKLIENGDNLLAVMLGNGWFNQGEIHAEGDFSLGTPRLAFSLSLTFADGSTALIESDETTLAGKSHIVKNNIYKGEKQHLSLKRDFFSSELDDSKWAHAVLVDAPEGELTLQDFTPDRIIRSITPKLIGKSMGKKLYDLGENATGYIEFDTSYKGKIVIDYTEELRGTRLDYASIGGKHRRSTDTYLADGRKHTAVHPHFTWHGFRYFTVSGEIENPVCRVMHTDIAVTSSFRCENEVINWLFDAYIRTQLANFHACVPSDCPHRERLGYTGDGQLCCESGMMLFDTKAAYGKWMQDIVDCQGVDGHIQHTAPFFGGGGGPCGWGGAVVVVPYFFYKQFGDLDFVRKYYGNILKWFEYIEAHCENGLVVREVDGGWCLGDWCVPDIDQKEFTPAFVNTCLLVKFYEYLDELEKALGVETDRSEIVNYHKYAIKSAYYNEQFSTCFGGKYGADAFILDIGLGDEKTLSNTVEKYDKLGYFDTGIFGMDILLRVLFERGYASTAAKLLASRAKKHSFGYMMDSGATTLWEELDGRDSHSHPMFGGCVRLLMQYFLGIRCTKAGWEKFVVAPYVTDITGDVSGYITTPKGKVSVDICREENGTHFTVEVFDGADAQFIFGDFTAKLNSGKNEFTI